MSRQVRFRDNGDMETAPRRFLCDEMLGRLARYLRAAGYDAVLANDGRSDGELLRQAAADGRVFLTLDRRIFEHKAARGVAHLLPAGDLDVLAGALNAAFEMDWMSRAFTRCLVDNTELLAFSEAERDRLPHNVDVAHTRFCPACRRLYWPGSHHRRMRQRLCQWQAQRESTAAGD